VPVSTPSYFPPNRTNDQIIGINAGIHYVGARCFLAGQAAGNNSTVPDIIIIGDNSFSQGVTDQSLAGTVSIGSQSLAALVTGNDSDLGAITAVGFNAGAGLVYACGNVIVGDNAMATSPGELGSLSEKNVVIGSGAGRYIGGPGENAFLNACVVIGYNAAAGGTEAGVAGTINECIIIGSNAATNVVSQSSSGVLDGAIIIGCNTAENISLGAGESGGIIIIGHDCYGSVSPFYSVLIGHSSAISAGSYNTNVGFAITSQGTSYNVGIGDHTNCGGANNVVIGSNAGAFEPPLNSNLVIETGQSDIVGFNTRLLFGAFGQIGNLSPTGLIIGDSSHALGNEDIQGRNTVKIVNGIVGSVNPIGGGYFYVSDGALHWVGSSGTDTVLAGA
jgi:hypothetical protein